MNNDLNEYTNDCNNDCLCQVIKCLIDICESGPTGPTERLFKSSNSIIIDSS